MRASLFIETIIEVEIDAATLAEAAEQAKKFRLFDIIKIKKGDSIDGSLTVLGVNHAWPSHGDTGEESRNVLSL